MVWRALEVDRTSRIVVMYHNVQNLDLCMPFDWLLQLLTERASTMRPHAAPVAVDLQYTLTSSWTFSSESRSSDLRRAHQSHHHIPSSEPSAPVPNAPRNAQRYYAMPRTRLLLVETEAHAVLALSASSSSWGGCWR